MAPALTPSLGILHAANSTKPVLIDTKRTAVVLQRRKEGFQRYRSSKSAACRPPKFFNNEGAADIFAEADTIPSGSFPSDNADAEVAEENRHRFRGVFGCFRKVGRGHRWFRLELSHCNGGSSRVEVAIPLTSRALNGCYP